MLQRILILYYTHSSLSSAIITLKMYEYYTGCFNQIVGASLSYGGCINKKLILIEFESHSWRGVLNTTLCDKICQWLATGRCFFLGTFYQWNWLPRYSWNIVESGVRHHIPNPLKQIWNAWRRSKYFKEKYKTISSLRF
jgi:hypothetical protein